MRLLRFALVTAVAVAGLPAGVAHAGPAGGNELFVTPSNTACSDAGPGTSREQPFCTVQAAANVASPGQTVKLSASAHTIASPGLTITRSGTAEAPIVFEADSTTPTARATLFLPDGQRFRIVEGVHHVQFRQLAFRQQAWNYAAVRVDDAQDITFESVTFLVHIGLANTQRVRILRSTTSRGLVIDGRSTGAVVSASRLSSESGPAVTIVGGSGIAITGNTILSSSGAVAVNGPVTETFIENNHFRHSTPDHLTAPFLTVDIQSVPGTTAKYNAPTQDPWAEPLYRWGDRSYTTIAAFQTGTGQGQADVLASNTGISVIPKELIDSADALAPGQLPTDINGNTRVRNPNVAATGTGVGYHDRGAYEAVQTPFELGDWGGASAWPPGPAVEAVWSQEFRTKWGAHSITATVDWGDGTKSDTGYPVAPLVDGAEATGLLTTRHLYAAPGTYTVSAVISDGMVEKRTTRQLVTGPRTGPVVATEPNTTQLKADFNGDGLGDTAMLYDYGNGDIALWTMTGQYDTGPAAPRLAWQGNGFGRGTQFVTAADFDGDGRSDVGLYYSDPRYSQEASFVTLPGTASGDFGQARLRWSSKQADTGVRQVVPGDFNGDGRVDLAIFRQFNDAGAQVRVLLATDRATLRDPVTWWSAYSWGAGTRAVSGGDLNGDKKTDLTLFYDYGDGHVSQFTMTATGDGGFAGPALSWDAPRWGRGTKLVQAGNFAGDGRADTALLYDYGNGHVSIWVLSAEGTLTRWWDGPVWGGGTKFLAAGGYSAKGGRDDLALFYDYGGAHQALFTVTPGKDVPVLRWDGPVWGGGTRALS
ncbi:FG-GAP repeat domain-containing protein [Longispora albida]|uniref:FG-GAP repeat domain-containing protein n=1 Tax=Longispora albida TaxID=203523 RepID=UPI0003763507|nr:VCBS repeat-containing protein [Longispora albida]